MQNNTQKNTFTYDINMPLVNNSFANRIATENYEYEIGTNLSNSEFIHTTTSGQSAIVKAFNDVDFTQTNNIYKSKYLEITRIHSLTSGYSERRYITNDFSVSSTRFRILYKIGSASYLYMRYYCNNEANDITFFLDIQNRWLVTSVNGVNKYVDATVVPAIGTYNNLYIEIETSYLHINYTLLYQIISYNDNGVILQNKQLSHDMGAYKNWKISSFYHSVTIPSVGQKFGIIAQDYNFITNKYAKFQKAIYNIEYNALDMLSFYLTIVPFYTTKLYNPVVTRYYYAISNYKNRYLSYLTNASDYDSVNSNIFISSINDLLENSFSITMELGTNDTELSKVVYIYFDNSFTTLSMLSNSYIALNSTILCQINNIYNNRVMINLQFLNKFLSVSVILNNSLFTTEVYVNDKFKQLGMNNFKLLNLDIKKLNIDNKISYVNSSIDVYSDILTFKNRVNQISIYAEFISIIYIPVNTITKIYDLNNVEYNIKSSKIINMIFIFNRDSENGEFSISLTDNYIHGIFNLTYGLWDIYTENLLENMDSGRIYIKSKFYTTTMNQVTLNTTIDYSRMLLFTDEIPANNMLIAKALEIMIPLLIVGLIVIGFKSNSDSKFLGFIGMYVAILTLYLMEYMSLLFMILCFIIQSIALYFIVTKEKSGEI